MASSVAILSVGHNGQITIPAAYRRAHALGRGVKVAAVRMGKALVLAPHDAVLESISARLEEAMRGESVTVEALKAATLGI